MDRIALKADSKIALRQATVNPYVVTIIMLIITGIMSGIDFGIRTWGETIESAPDILSTSFEPFLIVSFVFFIVTLLVGTLLQIGYSSFCLKVAKRDSSMSYGDLFSSVGYLLKAIGLIIVMNVFIMLWSFLLLIPGIIATFRYSQAIYIMIEDPSKGIMQCISESKQMMDGHKWEFFVLGMSFVLWIILTIITCGLGYIYVYPYMTVTFANYYKAIKSEATVVD